MAKVGAGVFLNKFAQDEAFYKNVFDVIEVQDFILPQNLDNRGAICAAYREKLQDFKGEITMHGPYMDLNTVSMDRRIRKLTGDRYIEVLEVAKVLKADKVIIHSSFDPAKKYREYLDTWVEKNVAFWERIVPDFERAGITVLIENVLDPSPGRLRSLVDQINSPNFSLCFDVGHAYVFGAIPLEEWVWTYKGAFDYIHVSDNDGTADAHLPLGEGWIDYDGLVELLLKEGINPTFISEVFTTPEREAEYLRELSFHFSQSR